MTGAAGEVGLPTAKVGRADPLDRFCRALKLMTAQASSTSA
jgi:hypothetical protein